MTKTIQHIAVIGAGAWGTALAQVFATAGRTVTLYARDTALAETINKTRRNALYLPQVTLHNNITATAQLPAAVIQADIVLLATPTQFVRHILSELKPVLPKGIALVNAAKGIEIASGKLLSEIAADIVPDHPYAVLSGPTFAIEAAQGLPTAVTLAAKTDMAVLEQWAQAFSSKTFRPYLSTDPVGAEIAGAVKNVIAIACGIVEGKQLGQNAKAAVMTRGMAEIKRLGLEKGAMAETFLGLSGIGDLTLTCHSMTSRNYSLGVELGRGRKLVDVVAERRTVAEGVSTARAVAEAARTLNVDMPICTGIDQILHHNAAIDDVVKDLLSRHIKSEGP